MKVADSILLMVPKAKVMVKITAKAAAAAVRIPQEVKVELVTQVVENTVLTMAEMVESIQKVDNVHLLHQIFC